MSKSSEKCSLLFFCFNSSFPIINDKENQQIMTFKELEPQMFETFVLEKMISQMIKNNWLLTFFQSTKLWQLYK